MDEERDSELKQACSRPLPPLAQKGIELFDRGEYFEAHEELELAWRAEPGPVRNLYQGILQIGIAYLHIQRGNYRGARKMFNRAKATLANLPDCCQGVDLSRFRAEYEAVEREISRLGAQRLDQFDQNLLRVVPKTNAPHGEK